MLALLVMAGATLSACSPTPEPSPTPTAAFASEEEAFAAAEEVYRAYNDAGNQSVEAANEYLVGEALDAQLETLRYFDQQGVSLTGSPVITSFDGLDAVVTDPVGSIEAFVCLDFEDTRVIDEAGKDVTPAERADVGRLRVTFVGNASDLAISNTESVDASTC